MSKVKDDVFRKTASKSSSPLQIVLASCLALVILGVAFFGGIIYFMSRVTDVAASAPAGKNSAKTEISASVQGLDNKKRDALRNSLVAVKPPRPPQSDDIERTGDIAQSPETEIRLPKTAEIAQDAPIKAVVLRRSGAVLKGSVTKRDGKVFIDDGANVLDFDSDSIERIDDLSNDELAAVLRDMENRATAKIAALANRNERARERRAKLDQQKAEDKEQIHKEAEQIVSQLEQKQIIEDLRSKGIDIQPKKATVWIDPLIWFQMDLWQKEAFLKKARSLMCTKVLSNRNDDVLGTFESLWEGPKILR